MPREPRVHFLGALYLVMARGDRREAIFRHHVDRLSYSSCAPSVWLVT